MGNILFGAPEGHDARILADMARKIMSEDRVVLHIAQDDRRMALLREMLAFFAPDVAVIELPAWDCLPYDRISPSSDIAARRVSALSQMLVWQGEARRYPRIVLTSVNAALQRVMPRETLKNAGFFAQVGQRIDVEQLQAYLVQNGYTRTDTVREAGEFAMRGGIIDLYPSGFENPVRLDLFGDEVESICFFDPLSQRSEQKIENFSLQPVTEFFLDKTSISRFRAKYLEHFGVPRDDDPLYIAVSEGRRYNGMEHWLPFFHEAMETLFDYVPNAALSFDHHGLEAAGERFEQIADFFQARHAMLQVAKHKRRERNGREGAMAVSGALYNPVVPDLLYFSHEEWGGRVSEGVTLSPFSGGMEDVESVEKESQAAKLPSQSYPPARKARDFADIRALPDGDIFGELKRYIAALNTKTTLIAAYSEGAASRISGLLSEHGFDDVALCPHFDAVKKLKPAQLGVAVLGLEHGFVSHDLAVLSEADIFGDRLTRKAAGRKRKSENFLREVSALNEGDLVVHIDHGVGKFIALETLKAAGTLHDCLKIEYAGGDKLYVPVENLEVLARFGADEGSVQLDKLGGAGWQARKARVKKDLMVMADQLLNIAAARKLQKAQKLDVSDTVYKQFAARFPYAETEDQERAIHDVIADIANDHPMDRLVCGDVGFGKTEVAIRAAYVAAMAGAQVALVVPTTLLARQHYNNFQRRFEGTGLRIGQLSRLVSAKDAALTKDGLREGTVNIVIGTHALFGAGIKFANLGLVIVDEEQRFGVKQKERLKEIKADVHVLTLTATPIPRTLQMSLTGVKEMSLITTPPVDRLAIRTFVMPVDGMVIREALMREHYRGGQSFYVCPRIADMRDLEDMLKELVPELKVIAAHGQMTPTELEDRMTEFYDGQYDILLATNIIESGIDIASANTMIVHRADMFGLAQLYQIRGRIGRSKVRAYAYLTYEAGVKLNDQAIKRLEVMETLDTLGSGFQLASHDMDIRGAGNLLGEQQSGHIREVGAELYQQLLEEAVALARSGGGLELMIEESWTPQINLGISILIPENYVPELNVRMSLYRRLQDLQTPEDIEAFAAEMIDRFGALPQEVENLLAVVAIKQLCKRAGVGSVDAGPKGAVIGFHKDTPPDVGALMGWIQSKAGTVKIRPDQKISVIRVWEKAEHRVNGVRTLMKELAAF
jgi:transcription-repair coupling factor (superfamily II helicase)